MINKKAILKIFSNKNFFIPKLEILSYICVIATAFFIPVSILFTNIFIYSAVIAYLLSGKWRDQYKSIFTNKIIIFPLILLILFIIGLFYNTATLESGLIFLRKYLKLIFIPLLLPIFQNEKVRNSSIYAFLSAILITLILSFVKKYGIIAINILGPYDAIFHNHINTSFFMAFAAFILANKFIFTSNKKFKWLFAFGFLILSYSVFFWFTGRTGHLTYFALLLLFLWQVFSWRGIISGIIIVPLVAATIFFMSDNFSARIKAAINDIVQYGERTNEFTSLGNRFGFVSNSIILIKQRPIIGFGTGSVQAEYDKNFVLPPEFSKGLGTLHNEYAMITVQLGIIGLLIFLLMFSYQFILSFSLTQPLFRNLAQSLVISGLVYSFCDSFLFLSTPCHFYVLFTSLFYSINTKPHT